MKQPSYAASIGPQLSQRQLSMRTIHQSCTPKQTGIDPHRPLVRYHGGKWRLAPWIVGYIPEHTAYVEPYGGGGSVLLRKWRSEIEIYNDLDGEMVNLLRVVRDRGTDLCRVLAATPYSRDEFELSYRECDDEVERARRTVVRSYMGFGSGGVSRLNADGNLQRTGFRVKFGKNQGPALWTGIPESVFSIMHRLKEVLIENTDAIALMSRHDTPDTVFYVDPPYVAETRDKGQDYKHEMTDEDHERLLDTLRSLRGTVLLSGYENPLYDHALVSWKRVTKRAMADGARPRTEVLWMNRDGRVA